MRQTRQGSLVESGVNVAIGYSVAFVSQMVVFPLVGVRASVGQNVTIGLIFTVVSIARSYVVRRTFNRFGWFTR